MERIKYLRITKDFGLNLLASLITTGVAQIIVYPFLASILASEDYGKLLTYMGIANMLAFTFGGSLNNTRLLIQEDYNKGCKVGDFNLIFYILIFIAVVVSSIIYFLVYKLQTWLAILTITFIIFSIFRLYLNVEYRVILNYKKMLYSNVCCVVGNIIGLGVFVYFSEKKMWIMPFLVGEMLCTLYTLKTTDIINEGIGKTHLFNKILGKETVLLVTSLSANILTYLDRILLLPLLGGTAVSCYTVASFFGKSLGIALTPLAGVILSYYAHKGFVMNRKLFRKINMLTTAMGGFFFIVSIFVAPIITKMLYSTIFNEARDYLIIANITAIVNVVAGMIQPSVMKFAPTFWQLVIQFIYCMIYLVGGLACIPIWGLWGFSIVALLGGLIKIVFLIIVGDVYIGKINVCSK